MSESKVPGVARDVPGSAVRRAVFWFCLVFVAIQILIPLFQLSQPPIQPFGWQMYSSIAGHRYDVDFSDGSTRLIDPEDFVLRYRSEIDYRGHLPQVLCERLPDATRVIATNGVEKTKDTYPCER